MNIQQETQQLTVKEVKEAAEAGDLGPLMQMQEAAYSRSNTALYVAGGAAVIATAAAIAAGVALFSGGDEDEPRRYDPGSPEVPYGV